MGVIEEKIGKNYIYYKTDEDNGNIIDTKEIIRSWENSFNYVKEDIEKDIKGLRTPQLGALFAIKAHWSVSNSSATIVMPTGTGKTESIISTIISEQCEKTIIVVPSNLLREQICNKCISLGILRELGVIDNKAKNPVVACIKSKPSTEEIKEIFLKSNIIVSTMKLISTFDEELLDEMCNKSTHLVIDEAHHIAAKTWNIVKSKFKSKIVLQFTATPFRNDEKKVDGKIIYNFPLKLAQEQGYFKPINFDAIIEFDEEKSDMEIAKKAVKKLEEDIKNGFEHILLVRCSTKQRSRDLYGIYNSKFKQYNPVLINSDLSDKQRKIEMNKIKSYESKILVCVDMFGEGIDIPNLKIAAIHDKYKSLPITLQFVGRFARTKANLGIATVIANIAKDDIKEGLRKLYSQDSDWNSLLQTLSSSAIGKEISLQDLIQGFDNSEVSDINIDQIIPKVSMIPYKVEGEWNGEGWSNILEEEKCRVSINEDKKILLIIEMREEKVMWTNNRTVSNISWHIHLIYWNKEKNIAFINSTDKGICNRLMGEIFKKPIRIIGEDIFKSLYGIKRLMLATVGLNTAINGPIRYKMFAGLDIAEGISESQKGNCTKSNLFGMGYNGEGRISIGCSYKGTIWSRWVETIDFWIDWCNDISNKILDDSIDTNEILRGVLKPKVIYTRPNKIPISIEYPMEFDYCNDERIYIKTSLYEVPIYDTELKISDIANIVSPIKFSLKSEKFSIDYELIFTEKDFYFKNTNKQIASIKFGDKEISLTEYFKENPPRIRFADQSTLEGNLYVELENMQNIKLDEENIEVWNWSGVDIKKESQTKSKIKDSIQYTVISKLKETGEYDIIFDDDGSGEIADIIAIKDKSDKVYFEYYHCKYSGEEKPGGRVGDLYEVCGQAQKSVEWKQNGSAIIQRMIRRESKRMANSNVSKIEIGSLKKLYEIYNKLSMFGYNLEINIVQPGVNSKQISDDMNQLLCSTKAYLMDTYGLKFKMICS